ncbi:E3 ubiquitin-protein ligase NEURL3-like isoform X1 [Simochromis diagramma]|uniref:E3 ubiquitin-protein ligase NEURL3-like isoform X1 n=1 Tax=Simochromis diagramma TaxID=43689 RepID=UPI001A7EECCB|nr:E3 ubiquitin-protein ligase NEURL3-like isoform X1 [Simochromis diagramma]
MTSFFYISKMARENKNKNSVLQSEVSHRCSLLCLGRLNFHRQAVGEKVRLSHGGRLAEKTDNTFKNGLVFSNRPVRVQERIRLRVERDSINWQGALRVGFTTVPPSARSLPLPCLAIPNLTDKPGHWAVPVNESYCQAGSELEFWVSHGGSIYVAVSNRQHKWLTGVDLSQPLWAMIDIYGKTRSILLLGSKKTKLLCTRRSCPAPEPLISPDSYSHFGSVPDVSDFRPDDCMSCLDMEIPADNVCVVCMVKEARITLPCGHRCLCKHCDSRVCQEFGTCPLCRHKIRAPSVKERRFIDV